VNSIYMTINFGVSAFVSLMVGLMADHFGLILTYRITAVLLLLSIPVAAVTLPHDSPSAS
ncbi:MAG: hypothetical protein ACQEQV_11000, partial [Fibrobacterota bacterium]